MDKERCRSHAKRMLATGITLDDATDRIHSIVTTVKRQEQRSARLERGKLVDKLLLMLEQFQSANSSVDTNLERRAAIVAIIIATRALADVDSYAVDVTS